MQPQGVLFDICCLVGSTLSPTVTEELLPNGSSNRRSCGGDVVGGHCSRISDEEILKYPHSCCKTRLHIFGKFVVHLFFIVWDCTVFNHHLAVHLCHVNSCTGHHFLFSVTPDSQPALNALESCWGAGRRTCALPCVWVTVTGMVDCFMPLKKIHPQYGRSDQACNH